MAKRVFELARDLGVTSKVVLEKCRAEGLEIKNHMSTLSAGLAATISEWFSEEVGGTAIETTDHIDLEKARAEAKKQRRRRKNKEDEGGEADETAVAVEEQPEEIAAEAPQQLDQVEAPAQPVAEVAEAVEEAAEEAVEAVEAEEAEPVEEKPEPVKEPEPIRPAGPQVVPKPAKLKGPKVIRVEKPDFVPVPSKRPAPQQRAVPSATPIPRKITPTTKFAEEEKKKGKKRSPRRRGGKTREVGEKLREWRDQDLLERSERLAAAGGGLRRHRTSVSKKREGAGAVAKMGDIHIDEPITVKSFSEATGIKASEIITKMMGLGVIATVNQVIDTEMAETIAVENDITLVVRESKSPEEELIEKIEARPKGELSSRAPVVTFLGHVDHGKTSLLDQIRKTSVATGEAGGITQHIGSYRYDVEGKQVVFLDTPGHEAFTAMRSRGANMTDVVVLVVAADDGVMPQTVEAISHAKAAEVPIIVALNKIDVSNANVQRALGQLAEHELQPREWGGDVEVIQTSAETGQGIEDLVETLSLEAELLELKGEVDAQASGYVIESEMDQNRGAVARLLVLNGTLRVGDVVLAGQGYGRVRQILNDRGKAIKQAGPSTPVEIAGLSEVPQAGDKFYVLDDIEKARTVAEDRHERTRSKVLGGGQKVTLENIFSQIEAGDVNELALIIKADVQGSLEALTGSLEKLSTDEVRVKILHTAVGGISTGDVSLAEASEAIIIGFNVVPDTSARQLAEEKGVSIQLYRVIYEIIEDIRKALEEGLAPEIKEEVLGHAEIRQTFKVSRIGTIAGCYVTDGKAVRNAKVRLLRNNIVVEDERTLDSLKRFKEDAKEVRNGMECGVKLAGYDDVKEGDVLEFYQQVEVARTL